MLMAIGFMVASYSIVANDAIQTLGTFLASNRSRPWWVLWLYAVGILYAVLIYGWMTHGGDTSYGRMDRIPLPRPFTWIYLVPPLVLLLLTKRGIPVSTTFLILTLFAPESLGDMMVKSLMGYAVAFLFAIGLYFAISETFERHFLATVHDEPATHWVALQWLSTGFLWTQWLIQDLANIFVYLPRRLDLGWLTFGLVVMAGLHAWTFYSQGGEIQRVVTSKTNTGDIRSATIVDFAFGIVLLVFKEWSRIPMSTTWVFLGLLAGREIAMSVRLRSRPMPETLRLVRNDGMRIAAGLAVSVLLAIALPRLSALITPVDQTPRLSSTGDVYPAARLNPLPRTENRRAGILGVDAQNGRLGGHP